MSGLLLNREQRETFIRWLRLEESTNHGLIEQMRKLPGPPLEPLVKKMQREAAACGIVASMLESIEEQTI
jgi:hypothetical protein